SCRSGFRFLGRRWWWWRSFIKVRCSEKDCPHQNEGEEQPHLHGQFFFVRRPGTLSSAPFEKIKHNYLLSTRLALLKSTSSDRALLRERDGSGARVLLPSTSRGQRHISRPPAACILNSSDSTGRPKAASATRPTCTNAK